MQKCRIEGCEDFVESYSNRRPGLYCLRHKAARGQNRNPRKPLPRVIPTFTVDSGENILRTQPR